MMLVACDPRPTAPQHFCLPALGSSTHCMGVYWRGLGSAFTTSMKLWHVGTRAFLPSEAG